MSIHESILLKNAWKCFNAPLISDLTDAEVEALEEEWGVHFFWERADDNTNTLRVLGFINGHLRDKQALLEGRFCDIEQLIIDFTVVINLRCKDTVLYGEVLQRQQEVGFLNDPATCKVRLEARNVPEIEHHHGRLVTRDQINAEVDEIIASEG